jgi:MFS family permease
VYERGLVKAVVAAGISQRRAPQIKFQLPTKTSAVKNMPPRNEDASSIQLDERVHQDDCSNAECSLIDRADGSREECFLTEFATARGPPQIVILCLLLSLAFGSVIGIIPAVTIDRYARLYHGYDGEDCGSFDIKAKPLPCLEGSADAQNAVAAEQMFSNILTFFTSSLLGSLSDEYGRRGILIIGVLISSLSPLLLVLIQLNTTMTPFWYYCAGALSGLVSWITVALSALSDVLPDRWRAPGFGMLLAGFSLGFAIAPQFAPLLGHFFTSILALAFVWGGLLLLIVWFPETLPKETAERARCTRHSLTEGLSPGAKALLNVKRPLWELSILFRSRIFGLLSALAFFSGLAASGDQTLLIYYIEERLSFDDKDIAALFLVVGFLGIFVQGFLLKLVNDCLGERKVVILSFSVGVLHNILYGFASSKSSIFAATAISALVGMSFPTIAAIKANNVGKK